MDKESPRKMPNTRSPKKLKSPVSSDSDESSVVNVTPAKRNSAGAGSAESSVASTNTSAAASASASPRCRSLRARKTWNYAKMLESNSEASDDSDNDDDNKQQDLRPRRQRRKRAIAAAGGGVAGRSSGGVSANDVMVRACRRNLAERRYVENTDSEGTEDDEEDDEGGVNISVSVSSRGRIRRLTAKARASVFRD